MQHTQSDEYDEGGQRDGSGLGRRAWLALRRLLPTRVANITHHAHRPAVPERARRGDHRNSRYPHNDTLLRNVVEFARRRALS